MNREDKRQLIHLALGFLAFCIPFFSRLDVIIFLGIMLVIAALIMPYSRLRYHVYREHEYHYSGGALWYFGSLLALAFVAPLSVVAGSWAVLAFGDGAATLVGHRIRSPRLPWNKDKSIAGTIGFVIFSSAALIVILQLMIPGFSGLQRIGVGIGVAAIAAAIETISWKINDNVAIVGVTGLILSALLYLA